MSDPYCHLCYDGIAVTSDGVCSKCAYEKPLKPRPPSREKVLESRIARTLKLIDEGIKDCIDREEDYYRGNRDACLVIRAALTGEEP